jgi:hypothetical protein
VAFNEMATATRKAPRTAMRYLIFSPPFRL